MILSGSIWAAAGYAVGTFPSALIAVRLAHADDVRAMARRGVGEADPHVLLVKSAGVGWAGVAATADVLKGSLFVLAARNLGHLDPAWLAAGGLAVVLGHAFPPFARDMAGRGLAAASGVYLALLPFEMTVAGLAIVLGALLRHTGLASTIAMASVPLVAAVRGQPAGFVVLGVCVFVLLMVRRAEGVAGTIGPNGSAMRALLRRCLLDSRGIEPSQEPEPL
jgi:acyl phosphate:glycerol-3-phosphate acyltransferase